jgi:uncharacterized membrane protein HdeD (DUF308 family)
LSTYPTESRNRPDTQGEGWVLFAGIMIMIAGFMNTIWGIAAIDGSSFFTDEGRYVILDDLNAWGWFILIVGVAQLIAAFSIWSGNEYGRWIGIITASVSFIILLFTINAFPFAAFMLMIVDILVIYGLVVYGGRQSPAA